MKIKITELNHGIISHNGSYEDDWGMKKSFDSFKIKEINRTRVYIVVMKKSVNMTIIGKKMFFDNGLITIKFNGEEIVIGKYKIVP